MLTKEKCIQKYHECKVSRNGDIPRRDEFLSYAGISSKALERVFGAKAYSKLQTAAGDDPNLSFNRPRTPWEEIMQQYGNLVMECRNLPAYAEWSSRDLKPTDSGLKKVHKLDWSEMPDRFVEWVTTNNVSEFDAAIEILSASGRAAPNKQGRGDAAFSRLIKDVRAWSPARRRNSEGEYKIELRKHLESLKHELNEEFGESKYDLLVRGVFAIEVKKDPDLAEYDRLFGQLARHLQHQCKVIVVILEATRGDKYDNFTALVDKYLNVGENAVEIVKK